MSAKKTRPGLVRRFLASLGPGIITGAADDDPSGIATYSIAGAQHGLALLWTALITWPLMAFTQMMGARIAVINGMLAPFLMAAILLIALDRTVMKGQPSAAVVSVATLLMFGAAIGMFIF